jgi:hypothetical protein
VNSAFDSSPLLLAFAADCLQLRLVRDTQQAKWLHSRSKAKRELSSVGASFIVQDIGLQLVMRVLAGAATITFNNDKLVSNVDSCGSQCKHFCRMTMTRKDAFLGSAFAGVFGINE